MRGALRIGISAAALLSAAAAWPATGAEDCTAIESAEARLACYDRQHGRSEPAAPAQPAPAPRAATAPAAPAADMPAPPPPAPAAGTANEPPAAAPSGQPADPGAFGREHLPEPARPPEAPEALTVDVTAVGQGMTGRRWFRLDNGQLWEQVTVRRTGIEAGDRVTLTRSPIGTYHLRRADGSSRSTQVRRRE
tara:strand:+ start:2952 stop:3530 length:579 start_codon:yes stop_codon:yes gene_type:complete